MKIVFFSLLASLLALSQQDDIYDSTRTLLLQLQTILQQKTEVATAQIYFAADGVKFIMNTSMAVGRKQLSNVADRFISDIDTMKSEWSGTTNISLCTHNETQISQLANDMTNQMISCVTTRANQALMGIDNIVNDVNATLRTVENLLDELDDCSADSECITAISVEAQRDYEDLPAQIDKLVSFAQDVVVGWQSIMENCYIVKVNELNDAGTQIVASISACISTLDQI